MLGEPAISQQVDVDPVGSDPLSGWRQTEPVTDVCAVIGPHDRHLIALRDDVLDGEPGIESGADHADALLQALNPLALLWEGVVLDVVGPGDLVEELEPSFVPDFLV